MRGSASRQRVRQALSATCLLFFIFLGLFVRYQLIGPFQADRFVEPAFFQRYRGVPVALSRGDILDRYGVPLHYPIWGSAVARFPVSSALFGDGPEKILRGASPSQLNAAVEGKLEEGLTLIPEETRYGPESLARHVVGHVRLNAYVNPADNIGESGLEKWFQSRLAGGYPASAGVVLTGEGSGMPGVGIRIAPPQNVPLDLFTTLDASVQLAVEEVLDRRGVRRGAAVVLDAETAEVLAMASRPNFDQNHPERSFNDPNSPLVNRAISAFAPGSVWKTVVMALALDRGYVDEDRVYLCNGSVQVGERTISCGSNGEGHGSVTVRQALALSCNSALIQCALSIPSVELIEFARSASFGQRTGIELSGESTGALPDPWHMYSGDKANFAIGQGYLSVTPLQMASFIRAVVAGGEWKSPVLIREAEQETKRLFTEDTAEVLQSALLLATREGTGQAAYVQLYGAAGKTGTAETGFSGDDSHAWFCGWTPVIAPKYVIAVFVEEGGDGPSVAAPVFREIGEQILPN